MEKVIHRNPIQIGTCSNEFEQSAITSMKYRELLYNRDDKSLGIIIDNPDADKYRQILSAIPDEKNVTINESRNTALKDDIEVQSYTATTDGKGIAWKSQYYLGAVTDDNKILLLFREEFEDAKNVAIIGGELFETGEDCYAHYQVTMSSNGHVFLKGSETNGSRARAVKCKYNDEWYYGIQFSDNAEIHLVGWKVIDEALLPPETYKDTDLTDIIALSDDANYKVTYLDYEAFNPKKYDYTWDFNDASISSNDLVNGYDFGQNLTLTTESEASYFPEDVIAKDTGYIALEEGNDFTLKLVAPCTVTIGCSSNEANIAVRFTAKAESTRTVSSSSVTTIARITYTKTTYEESTLVISHSGGIGRFFNISINYKQDEKYTNEAADYITSYIKSLEKTGSNGTPHIIKIEGLLNKNFILKTAAALKDPNKLVSLDLSGSSVDSDTADWNSDYEGDLAYGSEDQGGLFSAFYKCTSLKSFYYPANVTTSGGNTFYGCSALTDVHFNKEMITIGMGDNYLTDINGMFSGTRVKSVVIPASVQNISNYAFSSSNIENVYMRNSSYFETDDSTFNAYSQSWYNINESLKFYCNPNLLAVWEADDSTTFSGANGWGTQYISSSELRKDHLASWDNDETKIDYEA